MCMMVHDDVQAYIPLFLGAHGSIVSNPLGMQSKSS